MSRSLLLLALVCLFSFAYGWESKSTNITVEDMKVMSGTQILASAQLVSTSAAAVASSLPVNFDGRTKWPGCIHGIQNQWMCGSCYSFSSSGVLSDRFCIASGGKISVSLSTQDAVSCNPTTNGCNGGNIYKIWKYFETTGLVPNNCFPTMSQLGFQLQTCAEKFVGQGQLQGAICYPQCGAGYNGVGPVCWEVCNTNEGDGGVFCATCPAGLVYEAGLCYSPCPADYSGVGLACYLNDPSYSRGVAEAVKWGGCDANQDSEAGLCYKKCNPGYVGRATLCWKDKSLTLSRTTKVPTSSRTKRTFGRGAGQIPCPTNCNSYKASPNSHKYFTNEEDIKQELYTNGPLVYSFEVRNDFNGYSKGVYYSTAASTGGWHAVKLIGYGVENNEKYWLCQNSWGTSWGDNGYFKIRRDYTSYIEGGRAAV